MAISEKKAEGINFWVPRIGKEERLLVNQVLESNYLNDGNITHKFEQELAGLLGCRYVVAVTSGTAALFLSLAGLGIGLGDEVVVPDISFIAAANAVTLTGAKVVLSDIDYRTLNIDPQAFASVITSRTKAVIPVHVSGRAADLKAIMRIAGEKGISVVEDAAEAFMSRLNGRCLGTFGKTGCFSFSPNKIITTGQGGAVITNDKKLHIRLRELKDQGRPRRGSGGADIHNAVGYNFKFTDLQAAVGLGQLSLLSRRLKKMKRICDIYRKELNGLKQISLLPFNTAKGESPQWVDALAEDRDDLYRYLLKKRINCRKFWYPLHTQLPYRQDDGRFPVSSKLDKKAIWLPSAFTLTDTGIKYVCSQIKLFYSSR